jgi:hypothetical protein
LAAVSTLAAGVALLTTGTTAVADPISGCTTTNGARVAVDYGHFAGPVVVGCAATLTATTRGIDLLTAGGFTTRGDAHDGPRFLCRIASPSFPSPDATPTTPAGTGFPTPAQDACVVTPPMTAYWSFWLAPAGQNTWTFSPSGAFADHPTNGEVEAWVFGATDSGGTTGRPTFTPNQIRARITPTVVSAGVARLPRAAADIGTTPDLTAATHFLATNTDANGVADGTSLAVDGYYDGDVDFADWGLTIDGAFALAATGTDNATLANVVHVFTAGKADPSGDTANGWSGIGTAFAQGGSIGKEALLAEMTGFDPHSFGGNDLIAALDSIVCTAASSSCAAAGNYAFTASTFSQALAIMAQLRADDAANAAAPVDYLAGLQEADGGWSSAIPAADKSDVDSTAMAVMALALAPGDTAAAAVAKGIAWITAQQTADGGFPGAAGDSTNSAALAIQAMTLDKAAHQTQIDNALAFLAGQQNSDGGFTIAAGGQPGSDIRASAQAVGGAVGTSFGTLTDDISAVGTTTTPPPTSTTTTVPTTVPTTEGGAGGPDTTDGVPGALAFTGVHVGAMLGVGVLLLAAGVGLLLLLRRRAAVAGTRR